MRSLLLLTCFISLSSVLLFVSRSEAMGKPFQYVSATDANGSPDALGGWPASSLIDNNPGTVYSSNGFSSATNDRGLRLVLENSQVASVTQIILTARMSNGRPLGFPPSFNLQVTDPANIYWIDLGDFSVTPDTSGHAFVTLPHEYQTWGIIIRPTALGTDDHNNHYLQIADIDWSDAAITTNQCEIKITSCPAYPEFMPNGGLFSDTSNNAGTSQVACTDQASYWAHYCGIRLEGNFTDAVTATYSANGAVVASKTIGNTGCEITMANCPNRPAMVGSFYDNIADDWGVSANSNSTTCAAEAAYYYGLCGINDLSGYTVAAKFVSGGVVIPATPQVAQPTIHGTQHGEAACSMALPLQNSWLGADGDDSIQINAFGSLWLFDDTIVGANRTSFHMPRNTVGISRCNPTTGQSTIQYSWQNVGGVPSSFFPTNDSSWFWVTDSALVNGTPYIALQRTVQTAAGGPWGFAYSDTVLASLNMNLGAPTTWGLQYAPLNTASQSGIQLGSAMVVDGNFLLLYTQDTSGKVPYTNPIYLARIPLSGLNNPLQTIQYYANVGGGKTAWNRGLPNPQDAVTVLANAPGEFTVRYHPGINKWIAVYSLGVITPNIYVQEAPSAEGPWSAPTVVYSYPEMNPKSSHYINKNTFCYAAKEHTEYSADDSHIALTYACNADGATVAAHSEMYRPVPVIIPVP